MSLSKYDIIIKTYLANPNFSRKNLSIQLNCCERYIYKVIKKCCKSNLQFKPIQKNKGNFYNGWLQRGYTHLHLELIIQCALFTEWFHPGSNVWALEVGFDVVDSYIEKNKNKLNG